MKKLKDILSEAYAWERKPGKALPTLAEVQAEYQHNEATDAVKAKREDKTGSAGYGKPSKSGAKPDFLDLDKDGDTEEPMKDAADDMNEGASFQERFADYSNDALGDMIVTLRRFDGTKDDIRELEQELVRRKQDKDNVNEYGDDETHSLHVPETDVEPYDAAYEKPKDAMMESFWKRVNGNLHGHEHILREAFRK